ncbi:MAG: META domain-containing protein [Rhodothermales bacterium]
MILRFLLYLMTLSLVGSGCVLSKSSLDGTEWVLQRAETPTGSVTPAADVPTLRIEEGRIAGSDGCNQFSGSVQPTDDGRIAVSHLASTKRACPPPFDALSKAILGVLDGKTIANEVRGDELLLSAAGTTLVYTRR